MGQDFVDVGQFMVIKGEMSASQDLTHPRPGRRQDRVGPARTHHWTERKDQGAGVGQGGHRDGQRRRQYHGDREDRYSRKGLRQRRPRGTACAHCRRGTLSRPHRNAKLKSPKGPCERSGHGEATGSSAPGGSCALLGQDGLRYLHPTNTLVPIFHSRPAAGVSRLRAGRTTRRRWPSGHPESGAPMLDQYRRRWWRAPRSPHGAGRDHRAACPE